MQELQAVFSVAILIMSVVIHEVSHGYAALFFKDQTAKMAGRLTLNPIKHLDPVGSVLVPILLIVSHSPFPFGWARPVPINERNLVGGRKALILVAAAGVLANFLVAIIFGIFIRIMVIAGFQNQAFLYISSIIVLSNIGLAIFNLIPVPPLDGSKILLSLLPARMFSFIRFVESYAMILVILLIIVLWKFDFISPIIVFLFQLLTGVALQ